MDYLLNNRLLRHTLLWIAILFLSIIENAISGGWEWIHLIIYVSFLPSYIITVYIIFYWLIPNFLLKNKFLLFLILLEIINLIFLYSRLYLRPIIYPLIGVTPNSVRGFSLIIYYEFISHIVIGSAILLKLFKFWYEDKILKYELQKEKTVSELNVLKSQINPHFLLNALNNMDELIFEDQEKASAYLFDLSNILQYILYECKDDKILLEREIDFVKKYIKLYSVNLEDGFIDFKMKGSTRDLRIPPMLFIPLIENAMKHSNKNVDKPGIKIDLSINESYIRLKTTNYLKTSQTSTVSKKGIGLENLQKRLSLLYGKNHYLHLNADTSIFQTELSIPL